LQNQIHVYASKTKNSLYFSFIKAIFVALKIGSPLYSWLIFSPVNKSGLHLTQGTLIFTKAIGIRIIQTTAAYRKLPLKNLRDVLLF
jgi:hypothetical protein